MANKIANKIIMLEDLVDKFNGSLVKQIVYKEDLNTIYKHRPSSCPHCHSKEIIGIEVMGGKEGVLLWECEKCNDVFLKFDKDITEKGLQKARTCWTNPNDWGYCPKSQYN